MFLYTLYRMFIYILSINCKVCCVVAIVVAFVASVALATRLLGPNVINCQLEMENVKNVLLSLHFRVYLIKTDCKDKQFKEETIITISR